MTINYYVDDDGVIVMMVLSSFASSQTMVFICLACNITRSMIRSRASCLVMSFLIVSECDGGVEVGVGVGVIVDLEIFCFIHFYKVS